MSGGVSLRKHAKGLCRECIHPDHIVYADQKSATVFDEDDHKKYNAFMYFRERTCDPMMDAVQVSPGERHLGAEAYANFIAALESVNQQEYVVDGHCKAPEAGAEKDLVLRLAKEHLGVDEFGLDGEPWTPSELAAWERDVRLRQNATKAASFKDRLMERARQLKFDHRSEQGTGERWASCKHPPIRKETAELLSAPPEVDFSLVGALLFLVAAFTYVWNLYGQITAITAVCSATYLCPLDSRPHAPIPAPPHAFRRPAPHYYSSVSPGSLQPSKKEACTLGDQGCERPGYLVQWPYVQVANNGTLATEVPPEIKAKCPRSEGGDGGWVWDPYGRRLRGEYYDCSRGEAAGDDWIPFASGGIAMNFDKAWYLENNKATMACMRTAISQALVQLSEVSGFSSLSGAELEGANQMIGECVDSQQSLLKLGDRCLCNEDNWVTWPYFLFNGVFNGTTRTCDGGARGGLICTGDAVCAGSKCVDRFEDQVSIMVSSKFGCYFNGPEAAEMNVPAIKVCGSQYWGSGDTRSKSQAAQDQTAVDSFNLGNISLRTLLLVVFAVKEGAILTAAAAWCLVRLGTGALYLCVALLASPWLYYIYAQEDHKTQRLVRSIFDMVDAIVEEQLDILWRLCINLSTAYRIYGLVSALAHKLVNASIKDLDTKLTSVANLLYTLMLIFVRGGTPDATLVSGTALSLFTLLHKMNGESLLLSKLAKGFQDLNENRLTKFELALFLVKAMEKFLSSDVQYNWVEQLVGEPDFTPDIHEETSVHPRAIDAEPEAYVAQPRFLISTAARGIDDEDLAERNKAKAVRAEHSRELMRLKHASKFGHDGLGQFHKRYAKDQEGWAAGLTVTGESKIRSAQEFGAPAPVDVTPSVQRPDPAQGPVGIV